MPHRTVTVDQIKVSIPGLRGSGRVFFQRALYRFGFHAIPVESSPHEETHRRLACGTRPQRLDT